ncbi:hypothetical protein EF513_07450 [Rickettsiales endosymbiont of Stachyamoeba lipophora]|nr:hypothetical protein EF513_07450 [Rickettsiales endosymbiont of Stachyamoeba lipophora]
MLCVDLGIFDYLANNPCSVKDLSRKFNISEENIEALLITCCSEGLLHKKDQNFYLAKVSEEYLCENSLFSYKDFIKHLYIELEESRKYSIMRDSITTNIPANLGRQLFKEEFYATQLAENFAKAMYSKSIAPS